MSDDGKKTLGLMGGARSGNVKQSFSHGRTKNVVVETKRKRVVVPKPGAAKPAAPGAVRGGDPARRPAGISDAEMERRLKAVQAAKARETEDEARRAKKNASGRLNATVAAKNKKQKSANCANAKSGRRRKSPPKPRRSAKRRRQRCLRLHRHRHLKSGLQKPALCATKSLSPCAARNLRVQAVTKVGKTIAVLAS